MQKQKLRLFPDCPCCGERLEKKNEILPGLVQCPKCKNEHYVDSEYAQKTLSALSAADIKKNARQFNEAIDDYETIAKENPQLVEPHWGLFLCTYGIVYVPNAEKNRHTPVIYHYLDDKPTENRHFYKVLELSKDKYKNKHFVAEGELINEVWKDSKASLKKPVKKPIKIELPDQSSTEIITENMNIQKRGSQIPKDYKADPILENKIKNAEIIYLKTNKFSRANKIFDEVLEADPCAQRALWGKLLCKLQISDLDLLGPNVKINTVFPLFENVMECLSKADDNIYLKILQKYLFKKLNSVNTFDEELFTYIQSWKKKGEQQTFANQLYTEIKALLENDKLTDASWLHTALAAATQFNQIDDQALYISKYIEIAQQLNAHELYKDALKLAEAVLMVDQKNQEALLIQLCTTYKVPQLSELHLVLRDLKQIKVFEDLIQSGYTNLDIFAELELAAIELIEQNNYKQAVQLIDLYILHLPKNEEKALSKALLAFSGSLIYNERFKDAEKYVNQLIELEPLLPAAHWNKLRIALNANTNFDLLMFSKKDLMEYPEFAHAINSTSNPEDYIKFYEIHDQLKQPIPESRMFKRIAKKHYEDLEKKCGDADISTFVTTIVPKMKKEVLKLAVEERARVTNLFIRSVFVIIMVGFAFVLSNIRVFFDPAETNDSFVVAWQFWIFLQSLGGYILIAVFVIPFILVYLGEGNGFIKGLLRGLLFGLLFAAIGLSAIAGMPWAITRYLGTILFGLSTVIVSGVLYGLVVIGSVFTLRAYHIKLMEKTESAKTSRASWINIVILSVIIIGALAFSVSSLIL
ncbi:MAG: tetratricopeptide repeat protein [Bacillota bacterium]